ncbi:MAG: hypothetical protein DMF77_05495, partial [Acidobacteria bacterium]
MPFGVRMVKGTVAPALPPDSVNWRTISTPETSRSPCSREGSEWATSQPRPSTTYTSKRPSCPICLVVFHSGPRLATTSTTPWGAAPPGRTGSSRTMTGSCSDVEITGWLTIGLSCRPRSTPSCRSCSMMGSLSCTPER